MEHNTETGAPIVPVVDNKQKSGNSLKIATAIACIVAVCGIGFGIYGMIQNSQKDNQISDLKVQIKDADGTVTTIEAPEIKTTTDDGTTVTITDTAKVSGGPYIENGYFYVPKWGVKFKLSDNLTNYGYAVDQDSQGDSYGDYVVGLTALMKKDYMNNPQVQYYHDVFSCSVVTIRDANRNTSIDNAIEFGDKKFVIHDTWREWDCSNNEPYTSGYVSTDEVAKELTQILSNPEEI